MEQITYQDELIWGTSLNMAKENEIYECYKRVRDYIKNRSDDFNWCKKSNSTKSFMDTKWECGESARSQDLCDKMPSIKSEDFVKEVQSLVTADEVIVNGENILKSFENKGYISVYNCGRIFFLKDG